jgi:ribosome modulation factor
MSGNGRLNNSTHSEGVDAYLLERLREHCPYPPGSADRDAWLEGWDQTAHRERRLYTMPLLNDRRWFGEAEIPA